MASKKIFTDTSPILKNVRDAADYYARMRTLGEGSRGEYEPLPFKIKNSSGGDRRAGEILGLGDKLIDSMENGNLWFDGLAPAFCEPFGVLLYDLQDGVIGVASASGVCRALIDIANPCHSWATVAAGNHVLQSADAGPIRILWKPDDTGEQTCLVAFSWEQEDDCPACGSGSGSGGCITTLRGSLSAIPGYDATKMQALIHDHGCLEWLNIEPCEGGSGSGGA